MKRMSSGLLLAFLMSAAAAAAYSGTLVPVPPVNGYEAYVLGINDSDVIVGSYTDSSGVGHGFFGPISGKGYTTVDYKNGGTELRGINNAGYMTGVFNASASHCERGEFERYPTGKTKTITENGVALQGVVIGINKKNIFVGDYCDSQGYDHAYQGKSFKYVSDINVSISMDNYTRACGINSAGDIVGYFNASDGNWHGFLLSNGTATQIDYPSNKEVDTYLFGLNDKDTIAGAWDDTSGLTHAFLLNVSTGKFTDINVSGSILYVYSYAVNNYGVAAVDSDNGDYLYCSTKKNCPSGGVEMVDIGPTVPPGSFRKIILP